MPIIAIFCNGTTKHYKGYYLDDPSLGHHKMHTTRHDTLGYLDDILIFSESSEKHFEYLRTVFERLRMADVKFKRKRCDLFKHILHYLGHLISGYDIYSSTENI